MNYNKISELANQIDCLEHDINTIKTSKDLTLKVERDNVPTMSGEFWMTIKNNKIFNECIISILNEEMLGIKEKLNELLQKNK